jgi:hypothetical protein
MVWEAQLIEKGALGVDPGAKTAREEHTPMDQATATANRTGKPLIESDRVEGTTVYDPQGNNLGSIKRLMIDKISGQVSYAVMSFGGFLGIGAETCRALEQTHL